MALSGIDFEKDVVNPLAEAMTRRMLEYQAAGLHLPESMALRCGLGGDGIGGLMAQSIADRKWMEGRDEKDGKQ